MTNDSAHFTYFYLSGYIDSGPLRYLYVALIASLYAATVFSNVMLVVIICSKKALHEPMYFFLCSLFVNELYGSTGLLPFLMLQLFSDHHTVPLSFCFLQIFCLYHYAHVEFCNLAVMSYDRYLAICFPLHYNVRMTPKRAAALIALIWWYSFFKFLITFSLTVRLTLCGNVINRLYCHNYHVAMLACSDTSVNNIYGLVGTVVTVFVPLIPILFSYMQILRICLRGSKETQQKAISTCAPHLVSLLNFSFGCCFEIVSSRFDMTGVHAVLRLLLSLYFLICQPLLNPIVYGLRMSKIREICKQFLVVLPKAGICCRVT